MMLIIKIIITLPEKAPVFSITSLTISGAIMLVTFGYVFYPWCIGLMSVAIPNSPTLESYIIYIITVIAET